MASSPSPSSLDSVGTSPLGSFSDPNEHPLLARDLGLGPLVGYGDSGVFNGMNSTTFSSCSSMIHNSALSLYLNGLGSGGNLDSGSTLKVLSFFHFISLKSVEQCSTSSTMFDRTVDAADRKPILKTANGVVVLLLIDQDRDNRSPDPPVVINISCTY